MINPQDEYVFSVGELNESVRQLLEKNFTQIWVAGEISNFMQPASGHMYFSMKDQRGQVRCAYFRGRQHSLKFLPENGQQVIACGKLSLYPERGDYQLIVEHLLVSGEGELKQQFELLKKKLESEGLFNADHKKPLPKTINNLGVITSASGAALQDVLSVLKRRWPLMNVIVYDSLVQGEAAPMQLVSALLFAQKQQRCDAFLLTRGGGSLEDLWAFNDEQLARAIFACETPIISAVGHEVDFSISDFVADLRAPTPSAAAEVLSQDQVEIFNALRQSSIAMQNLIRDRIDQLQQHLLHLSKRLQHPADKLNAQGQHLDHLSKRLTQSLQMHLQVAKQTLQNQENKLNNLLPLQLANAKETFARLAERLNTLSPLATLQRGYALVQDEQKHVITKSNNLKKGQTISVSLSEGKLSATVTSIEN